MLIRMTEPHTYDVCLPRVPIIQNGKQVMEPIPVNGEKVPATVPQKPVQFKPGVNRIDEKEWDKVKENEFVQIRIDSGVLVIEGEHDALEEYEPKKAMHLITHCHDLSLLKQWLKDNRDAPAEFIDALRLQIMQLENPQKFAREQNEKRTSRKHKSEPEYLRKRASISELKGKKEKVS